MKYKRWKRIRKSCCALAVAAMMVASAGCASTKAVNGAWWDVNYDCKAYPEQPGCVDTTGGDSSGNGSGCTG